MEAIGKFFVTIIMSLLSIIGRGFVIMKLWVWFIVTTFSITVITLVQAIGLSLVIGLLTGELKPDEDTNNDDWFSKVILRFVFLIIVYVVVLFEGWIVHLFM